MLANYIFDQKSINPSADNNWSFAPIGGDVKVIFDSSPGAQQAAEEMGFVPLGDGEGGFARYEIEMK